MDCEKYEIRYSFEVFEMIDEIYKHIEKFTLSTQSAQKVVSEIILGMDKLEIFPERGFNVDDRVGKQLKPPYKTSGLVVGQYITFHFKCINNNSLLF
ncbi:MAG: addiction module toxin RelE [Firmicutes bacterium]|nr:addiction module toxin RelE [Bacillota bacterium]